jgi:hypothetical protein
LHQKFKSPEKAPGAPLAFLLPGAGMLGHIGVAYPVAPRGHRVESLREMMLAAGDETGQARRFSFTEMRGRVVANFVANSGENPMFVLVSVIARVG